MPAGSEGAEEPAPEDFETALGPDDDAGDDAGEEIGAVTGDFEPEAAPEPEPQPEPVAATEPSAPERVSGPDAAAGEPAEEPGEAVDDDADAYEDEETGPPPGFEGMVAPKRDLDQNLRAILQEEVAREMAARAADTAPSATETAPGDVDAASPDAEDEDLQLIREPSRPFEDDAVADTAPAPADDRVDVFAAPPGLAAEPDKGSRKDLFPDIDEINSTLDSHGPDSDEEDDDGDDERSGFGRAFFTVIAIAALLLALYLVAPKLAASVPALEPVLSGYVGLINSIRGIFSGLL